MWWPTPSDPGRWFDPADVVASKNQGRRRLSWGFGVAKSSERRALDEPRFAALAATAGATSVRFQVDPQLVGHNAFVDGATVVVSPSLLTQPDALQDWLVAHELAHVVRHHRRRLTIVGLGIALAVVVAAGMTHLTVAAPAGLLGLLGYRFVARAFERQADLDAGVMTERPDMRDLAHLITTSGQNLAPSFGQKLLLRHPAPAERLELLSLL